MHDPMTFEARLADAFERYVALAPTAANASAVAAAAADARQSRRASGQSSRRAVVLALAAALVVALIAGAALVIGHLLQAPPLPHPRAYTNQFAAQPNLGLSRIDPIIIALPDGRVLVAGGQIAFGDLREISVELYDPGTGTSTSIATGGPSGWGNAVLLPDGQVFAIVLDTNMTSS